MPSTPSPVHIGTLVIIQTRAYVYAAINMVRDATAALHLVSLDIMFIGIYLGLDYLYTG